jgi:hypothetical protein
VIADLFGRGFSVGDTIVYPLRQGSRMWMESAEVIDVKTASLGIKKDNGNKTTIRNFSSCIIAPEGWTQQDD